MKRISPAILAVSFALLLLAPVLTVWGYDPVPGQELLPRLQSPLFLTNGAGVAGGSDAANPASSALQQRIHLQAGYTAIVGNSSWEGHAASAGVVVPTRAGVFGGSLGFAGVGYDALNLGTRGTLNLHAAKDLYPDWLVGFGLTGTLADQAGVTPFSGGANLGVIHLLGPVSFMPDLRVGFALRQLGIGPPSPFTPAIDVQARLLETTEVTLDFGTGFDAPSFQNLVWRVGTTATFYDRVSVHAGWHVNLREQLEQNVPAGSLLPAVGISARFATDGREPPLEVLTTAAAAPLYDSVWAASAGVEVSFGVVDRTPPRISVEYPEPFWMSPNNDGLADELLLPVQITDERFVMSWALVVEDLQGALVRRIENKELRPENEGFRNIIDRLLYVRTGVDVPPIIRWDGRTEAGEIAPDGEYRFFIQAADDNENIATTELMTVFVDNTPPEVVITVPEDPDDLVFSPDGDGLKDTLTIVQESSVEDLWTVEILDIEDRPVFQRQFTDTALEDFVWDGLDSSGTVVPDGVYSYRAFATDRALNDGQETLENIIVDTVPTPVGLAVDVGHFSPNNNGRRDTITFTPDVPVTAGVREHILEIVDASDTVYRAFSGGEDIPERWVFDGRGADGRLLPEGSYLAVLRVFYRNGNEPVAVSPSWVLDVTAPRVSVIAEDDILSPDGDGRKDTITFLQDTDEALLWTAIIQNEAGETVRSYSWSGRPESQLIWDGRSDDGARVADGPYRYTLTGEDRAGNRASSRAFPFAVDTRDTPIFLATGHGAFAPGTAGPRPTLDLLPEVADPTGAERFLLEVVNTQGATVARIEGVGAPDGRYPWDGRGIQGGIVPDGMYRARLTVSYRHGNQPEALSAPFQIDTVPPRVQVALTDPERAFSPDGDGQKDTIEIRQSSSTEELWQGRIENTATDEVVRTLNVSGALEAFFWDGTDDSGEVVPDGEYRYVVEAVDAAGNSALGSTRSFRSDTRDVEIRLRISDRAFRQTVTFLPESNVLEGVAEWELRVLDSQENARWEQTGTGALRPVVWDGAGVPDGEYRGELSVRYVTGANPTVRSATTVLLDRVPPEVQVALSTEIISPNGDGRLDEVVITQQSSREERWIGTLQNAAGDTVRRWEWVGTAAEQFTFSGLDDQQRRLPDGQYRYELSARDLAGNSGTSGVHNLEIYTAETPLALSADLPAFSPNGDGVQDQMTFTPRTGDARGLQRWDFTITDNRTGSVAFRRSGTALPQTLTWNGRTDGALAPEGAYQAEMVLEYRHGNRPVARSESFILDVTSPAVSVSVDHRVFSPDGDGQRDVVVFTQRSDTALSWQGVITNAAGEAVRTYSWPERTADFTWDGTDEAGNTVPDGIYRYDVQGTDPAGNTGAAAVQTIEVDTVPARLFLTLDRRIIAPGTTGSGATTLSATLITNRTSGGLYRLLEVLDSNETVVRRLRSETVRGRETVEWDGRRENGTVVDGEYTLRYSVAYRNGAIPETRSPSVLVDSTPPQISVSLEGLPFSPDNDGINDELGIVLNAVDAGGIASWNFEIYDRNRRVFQQFSGSGQPRRQIVWDGRSRTGDLVVSAEDYPYRFTVTDRVGNVSETTGAIPIDILVVRDGDRLRIQIQNINFQPNSPQLQLDRSTPEGAKNIEVLDRLVQIFDRYQNYRIQVEGHAVALLGTELEETRTLQPLSHSRAASVRDALVQRGMDPARINVVGRGGLEPIVPHTDLENRWRNRRVDFLLIR